MNMSYINAILYFYNSILFYNLYWCTIIAVYPSDDTDEIQNLIYSTTKISFEQEPTNVIKLQILRNKNIEATAEKTPESKDSNTLIFYGILA